MTYASDWTAPALSPDDVVRGITSGMRVFVHGQAATPTPLLEALTRRTDLEGVTLYHMHLEGATPWLAPGYEGRIRSVSLFTSATVRDAVNSGRADHVPVFLSDIPGLFTSGQIRLDAAIVQLSSPDRHGYCSLGTGVDAAHRSHGTPRFHLDHRRGHGRERDPLPDQHRPHLRPHLS